MSTLVTFQDGSQIQKALISTVNMNIEAFLEIEGNFPAYVELVKKCQDTNYIITANKECNSPAILKDWRLINSEGQVHSDIRKIILNSTILRFPIDPARVSVVREGTGEK
jgi:hypothetical protein